jgi:hypothetical protein
MTRDVEQEKDVAAAAAPPRLQSLLASIGAAKARGPAPVDLWHPPYCGEIDLRIASDGTWFYAGTPILRPALVALFAGILRKDPERYVLVTPVECVGIVVEDVPFIGVAMAEDSGALVIGTNLGDEVRAGAEHPLRFTLDAAGGVKPYVHIRGGLWARLTRSLALDLLDRGEARMHDGAETFGVSSGGVFFPVTADEASRA